MPHSDELLSRMLSTAALVPVTVGASPFTYIAPDAGLIVLQGGTVNLVELGRGVTFVNVGLLTGAVPVSKGDQVRLTYIVAPAMTYFRS